MTNFNKSLICITTCNRLSLFKRFIWNYLVFIEDRDDFFLTVSLDGTDQAYIDFCATYRIPIVYSDEREGVGLSKNRVLEAYPDYNYYFFIEDDVELLNEEVFQQCLDVMASAGLEHLCGNLNHAKVEVKKIDNFVLDCSWFGGGYFAVYSKTGLEKVGGWNTIFAQYKRFGHTEHSYRFFHSQIQEYPFIFPRVCNKYILVHSPPSVTTNSVFETNNNDLFVEEQLLIDNETKYVALETLSHFQTVNYSEKPIIPYSANRNSKRYPLLKGLERRVALAEHYGNRIQNASNILNKLVFIAKSFYFYPTNTALKHYIKTTLFGKR